MILNTKGFSMKYLFLAVATCSLLWVASGCSRESASKLVQRMAPDEEQALAVKAIQTLRDGTDAQARALMNPKCNQATSDTDLHQLQEQIADINPADGVLVGYFSEKNIGGGNSQTTLNYEYKLNDHSYQIISVLLDTSSKPSTLLGCHLTKSKVSAMDAFSFSLKNKPPINHIIFVLAILIPLFSLFALVQCIRTKVRRKWLWILFILFSFGSISLNWNTSDLHFTLIQFQLFGAGCGQGMGGPWMLSIGFPLGAIWFLVKRKALTLAPTPETSPDEDS
jgi:hypothetical protein